MNLQKNDFIEIEFTGKLKESGNPFDSNIPEELSKINPQHSPEQAKPFKFSLGHDMFLQGIDNFLIGKEIEKFPAEFKIELNPENAFGKRNSKMVQLMPIKVFHQHNVRPVPGIPFNFDGRIGKVLAVSGGRVIVDFNNPLAGKEVIYDIKILRKIDDQDEKIKSLIEFLFKKEIPFETKDKKVILKTEDSQMKQYVGMLKDKFKEVLDMDLELENSQKSEENKTE
jgi:FKBP-type peptidyl-prolyl cis-trans isomerase SlyD